MVRRLLVLSLVAALALTACGGGGSSSAVDEPPAPAPSARPELSDLGNVLDLRAAFNEDQGAPRLILLLSPT